MSAPLKAGRSTLRVQSVLYGLSQDAVARYLGGLRAAARVARDEGLFNEIVLALGDCSQKPTFTTDEVVSLRKESAEELSDLTYDYFGSNLGSAGGHNRLLDAATQDLILILNPDTYCSPQLLSELMLPLNDSGVGIVEARQLPFEHPKVYDVRTGATSWACTCCCIIRKEVFDQIGGFDSASFFLYCDDVDFSWRTRLAGWSIYFQPSARVFHDKRLTKSGTLDVGAAEIYYAAEASLMMAWKYSREDLVLKYLALFDESEEPLHGKAAATFRTRRDEGQLCGQLDPEGRVAQFIGYNYGPHRFSYDD